MVTAVPTQTAPRVTVVLPTRNRVADLKRAVDSVISQSFEALELLILDDDSSDATAEFVAALAASDPRVRPLKSGPARRNLQALLNVGLQAARGDYVARIDDDDVWLDRQKLARQVAFLDAHPDVVLVGTGAVIVDEAGRELFRYSHPAADEAIRRRLLLKNCFANSSVLFRRAAAVAVNGYDTSLVYSGDYDLWLKLGQRGVFHNFTEPMVAIRNSEAGLGVRRRTRRRDDWRILTRHRGAYPQGVRARGLWLLKLLYVSLPRIRTIDRWVYGAYRRW